MRNFITHPVAAACLALSLVTGAVTLRAQDNWQHRTASPEHAWNVVLSITTNGGEPRLFKYSPDHTEDGRLYESEAACKNAIDNDPDLHSVQADVQSAVAEFLQANPHSTVEVSIGCMNVDDEPRSF